ncbi:MAG: glycosyltransferase [Desulfovibrio sp.]|nr:glycosyltransferase [Desulfovibrio sp.]
MKYSIITSTFNAEKLIARAADSIFGQSYPNFEWLVQDGGSTDNTLAILEKYTDHRLKVESRSDSGIYSAWNRGIARSGGDWAIFIGADDFLLHTDTLVKCHRHIRRMDKDIQFAYAATVRLRGKEIVEIENLSLYEVYLRFNHRLGFPMPSTFVRMPLLKAYPFEEKKYKIAADVDFVARFYTGKNIARIPVLAVGMEQGGASTTPANMCLVRDEMCRILCERYYPRAEEIMLNVINHYHDRDKNLED